jgi:hypothetical protein
MMVEARCENGEEESESNYEYSDSIDDTANNANENTNAGNIQQVPLSYDSNNGRDNVDKYAMAHRRWEYLYSAEGAIKLHDAVKRHVYKAKFGDDGTLDAPAIFYDGYDPLDIF